MVAARVRGDGVIGFLPTLLAGFHVPRQPINLHQKVREVLQHTSPLLPEADRPIRHFERSVNAGLLLLDYFDDHIDSNDVYVAVYDRYFGHLRRMVLAELIETFERFLLHFGYLERQAVRLAQRVQRERLPERIDVMDHGFAFG